MLEGRVRVRLQGCAGFWSRGRDDTRHLMLVSRRFYLLLLTLRNSTFNLVAEEEDQKNICADFARRMFRNTYETAPCMACDIFRIKKRPILMTMSSSFGQSYDLW